MDCGSVPRGNREHGVSFGKYILVGHEPIEIDDVLEWARWFECDTEARRVGLTELDYGRVRVSTIFLGLDHNFLFEDAPPILFETMIFGGTMNHECERYSTWDEAVIGHAYMVQCVEEMLTLERML